MKELNSSCFPPFEKRRKQTNKYDYGSILIIGGSIGFQGAPLLSGLVALRNGSGLVTIAMEQEALMYMTNPFPELMIKPYETTNDILNILNKKYDAILFGPGLNPNKDINNEILALLLDSNKPLIIDASGLAILKGHLKRDDFHNVIITPHTGEACKLLDVPKESIDFTSLLNKEMTIVLKDATTLIMNKDEKYISDLGNPGMATAGTGDVLAGIISSFVGQKYSLLESAKRGVYIHSLAGQEARRDKSETSMIASDLINALPTVYLHIEENK